MLGLSPQSRKDLLTAAEILSDYKESLDSENQPYDKIQKKQIETMLADFHKVIKETTV